MRYVAATLALCLFLLSGCGGNDAADLSEGPVVVDETADVAVGGSEVVEVDSDAEDAAVEPVEDNPLGLEPGQTLYSVASAKAGDRACYLTLEPSVEDGPAITREASFEICEMDVLQGQNIVIVEEEESNVMAASCEGDMDCTDVDVVNLITEVRLVSL